jgi:hypothetical protein
MICFMDGTGCTANRNFQRLFLGAQPDRVFQFKQYLRSLTHGIEAKNIAILTGGSIVITPVIQLTAAEVVNHVPTSGTSGKWSSGSSPGRTNSPDQR